MLNLFLSQNCPTESPLLENSIQTPHIPYQVQTLVTDLTLQDRQKFEPTNNKKHEFFLNVFNTQEKELNTLIVFFFA